MGGSGTESRLSRFAALAIAVGVVSFSGCIGGPVRGMIETRSSFFGNANFNGQIAAKLDGPVKIEIPPAPDPGPMIAVPVRPGRPDMRIAIIDVDGLLLNQNLSGLYAVGENPVASFREKLQAAAADPAVRTVVVRINSPGGSVTAADILAEELRRFRQETGRPVVTCLMDLATSGAYYLAVGGDRVVAHPTTITGGVGALLNHYNLQDAAAQFNARSGAVKSGPKVDIGSYTGPLPDDDARLLQEMVDGFGERFRKRVAERRKGMTREDLASIADGRVVAAQKALDLHLIDRVGYVHEALEEAESLAGIQGGEVVIFQRKGYPTHSIYAITPAPVDGGLVPFSVPGLDRAKLPTFLYLWQPDPTLLGLGSR